MRLVTFRLTAPVGGAVHSEHVGVLYPLGGAPGTHTHVVDLTEAFAAQSGQEPLCGMRHLLEMGASGLERAASVAAAADGTFRRPIGSVEICAPISNPEKLICVGMNVCAAQPCALPLP